MKIKITHTGNYGYGQCKVTNAETGESIDSAYKVEYSTDAKGNTECKLYLSQVELEIEADAKIIVKNQNTNTFNCPYINKQYLE